MWTPTKAPPLTFALASCVMAAASLHWTAYYANQPLWVEHAAYGMWSNITFLDALAREGYWDALRDALAGARHPLQPAILGLVSPRLLSWPHAHLLVTAVSLYLFLGLLVRFASRRNSTPFAVGVALLFCTFAGIFETNTGMGVPWPDYQSMFFLSSAALSLGLYAQSRARGDAPAGPAPANAAWLGLAGLCLSLGTLTRDTGSVYGAVICLPIVALLLLQEVRRTRRVWAAVRLGLWFAVPALPAAYLLVNRIPFFRQYYMTSNAWQLRHPLADSAHDIAAQVMSFCGPLALAAMGLLAAGALRRQDKRWTTADVVVVYWPASLVLFLLVNGYTGNWAKEVMYVTPGLLCAAVLPGGGMELRSRRSRLLFAGVLAVCAVGSAAAAVTTYQSAGRPDERATSLRTSQHVIAQALASFPRRITWQSYSAYDWGTPVAALTLFEFGRYQPTDNRWFFNRKAYWDAVFPNMNLAQLQAFVAAQTDAHVDVAIVLRDPAIKPEGMEDYSFAIASAVAAHVSASPRWQRYRDVETSAGPLSLHVNLSRLATPTDLAPAAAASRSRSE